MSPFAIYALGFVIGFAVACAFMHHIVYQGMPTLWGMAIDDFFNVYESMRRHGHGRIASLRRAWDCI